MRLSKLMLLEDAETRQAHEASILPRVHSGRLEEILTSLHSD